MQTAMKQDLDTYEFIGKGKKVRRAYGFDEIALVPGALTLDAELCDISVKINKHKLALPILASAMDSVVDVKMAQALGALGGLAVLNLQGLQTRYENPAAAYKQIANCDNSEFVAVMQKLYAAPVQKELITQRIKEVKEKNVICAAAVTPNQAFAYAYEAADAGLDILVIQSTVTGSEHRSASGGLSLDLKALCKELAIPVIVGNCVTYDAALKLLQTGVAGILVGVGPGAACTSRAVLGIGVPMATAVADCAFAKKDYEAATGRSVMVIADGGMVVGGDICKAIASGADAVMIGSPLARAAEAPGGGFHWGMATPSPLLPRGTRIKVGCSGTLKQILLGPASTDDGTQNLVGALTTSMATLGAASIAEMQQVEIVIAPAILTEGKVFQTAQHLGMGRL